MLPAYFEKSPSDAGVTAVYIDKIILVGGIAGIPIVQKILVDKIGEKIANEVDSVYCVCFGYAIEVNKKNVNE